MGKIRNKNRILFGFKSVPYPLRADGVSVRYFPIIEYLARRHDVDLIVIPGREEELLNLGGLKKHCRKIFVLQDPQRFQHNIFAKFLTYANFLLPWTPPISVVSHNGSEVSRGIIEATNKEHYDTVVWAGGYLLPNLLAALPSMSVGKVFVDFIDSPYLWSIRREESVFRIRLLEQYEQWKTRRWEGDVIGRADGTIYISRVDAEAVPTGNAPMDKRHVIPNGINIPAEVSKESVSLPSPNIGFLGTMGYPPNIEAVEWLYKQVFVPLRVNHPNLTLIVIGRYPSQSILDLGKQPGVIVTGGVEDIWAYINAIDVFLFPLLRGAGLKNKILEAMYAGRPVVTTEIGNEGIDAIPGKEFVLGRTAEDFQREAIRLLESPQERLRMGNSALAFVKDKFSWAPILSSYENITLGHIPESDPECNPKRDPVETASGNR